MDCFFFLLLSTHLWHFPANHVPTVDILKMCSNFSVESQLQSKGLRWLGHTFRMVDNRLLKGVVWLVQGCHPPGRSMLTFNDVASIEWHKCCITRPYKDAQNRVLWRDKTCPARTLLNMTWSLIKLLLLLQHSHIAICHDYSMCVSVLCQNAGPG